MAGGGQGGGGRAVQEGAVGRRRNGAGAGRRSAGPQSDQADGSDIRGWYDGWSNLTRIGSPPSVDTGVAMPSTFRFSIENARCFRDTGFIPITPITFLTGENSSGKTSFFALMYEAITSFFGYYSADEEMGFDLGSFDDLIHKSKNQPNSREYSLRFRIPTPDVKNKDLPSEIEDITLALTYGEFRGQRIITRIVIAMGETIISLRKTDKSIVVSIPLPTGICEARVSTKESSFYPTSDLGGYYRVRRMLDAVRHGLRSGRGDNQFLVAISRAAKANAVLFLRSITLALTGLEHVNQSLSWPIQGTAPIRSAPKRVYLIGSSGQSNPVDRVPLALNQLKLYEPEKWRLVKQKLSQFGISTGLFHDIDVQRLKGRKRDAPFELIVSHGDIQSNIKDVGYGISQVIPFVVDLIVSEIEGMSKRSAPVGMHYIQQPEIHLHPAAQAALGTFLYNFSKATGHYFIIETHSDFVIDRMRQHVREEKRLSSDRCSLLFFEDVGGESKIHPISFDDKGNVINAPRSYRQFFLTEEMRNFGV